MEARSKPVEKKDESKKLKSGNSHLKSTNQQQRELSPHLLYEDAKKGNGEAVQRLRLLTKNWDFPIPYQASFYLGLIFQHGYGKQTKNPSEAAKWYFTAITSFGSNTQPIKHLEELVRLEKEREANGQTPNATIYIKLACTYLILGDVSDDCLPKEYVTQKKLLFEKAVSLLRHAAKLSNKDAMYQLGLLCENGNSYYEFKANPVQALEWYRLCKDTIPEANFHFVKLEQAENTRMQNLLKLWSNRSDKLKQREQLQDIEISKIFTFK